MVKIRPQKRISFIKILAIALVLALGASGIFAFGFKEYLIQSIRDGMKMEMEGHTVSTVNHINSKSAELQNPIAELDSYLPSYTYYTVELGVLSSNLFGAFISSEISENCYAAAALIDKDNNIVASSEYSLGAFFIFGEKDKSWCSCKRGTKGTEELFAVLDEIKEKHGKLCDYRFTIESAYVDKDDYLFVPHKCTISVVEYEKDFFGEGMSGYKILDEYELELDFDDEKYEFMELKQKFNEKPRVFLCYERGVEENIFNELFGDIEYTSGSGVNSHIKTVNGSEVFCLEKYLEVELNGEKYKFCIVYTLDENNPDITKFLIIRIVLFTVLAVIIAVLASWAINTKNQARYGFEDYQRSLINNLAHDMKTPLTAMGGYAENALESLKNGNKEDPEKFLRSILDNVFYMDSVVNRTLELNHLEKYDKLKKEPVDMNKIAENAIEKYSLLLDEKNIIFEIKGDCTLNADKNTMTAAVENLISNAVKYTVEGGKISVVSDKNSIAVINDTAENIKTDDLTMPFVKGDGARNEKSSGLGLTIVQNAVNANKLKLKISSSGNKFKAVISK